MKNKRLKNEENENLVHDRKEKLIDSYARCEKAEHAKSAFWLSATKFYKYEESGQSSYLTEAKDMFYFGINKTISAFGLMGGLYNYYAYHHLYDDQMLEVFENHYIHTDLYDKERYTANHLLMSAVTRYLAEELFPGKIKCVIFEEDKTCKKTLMRLLVDYVQNGEPEWNSGSYLAVHYACLRLLAQYAKDEEMKKRAEMVSEWLLIKGAMTWMDGHVALSNERAYKPFRAQNEANGGTVLLYIYFGGEVPVDREGWFNVHALLSDYMPPKIIYDILIDKVKKPFSHEERHYFHIKDRIHFYDPALTDEGRMDVSNYAYLRSYMNKSYGMYSCAEWVEPVHEYVEFMDRFYIQMHRWGLCFTGKEGASVFYLEHPSGVKTKDVGATAWERVLQYESSIIGIYHIPSDRPDRTMECFIPKDKRKEPEKYLGQQLMEHHHYIIGHIPTNYDRCINTCQDGRIYLDYGEFMVALCMTAPFLWDEGDAEFRRETENLAFVLEVSDEFDDLQAFKAGVDEKFDQLSFDEGKLALTYETLKGTSLKTQFIKDGSRVDTINGRDIDYKVKKTVDNPWMEQDQYGDRLTISYKGEKLTYDFRKWHKNNSLIS